MESESTQTGYGELVKKHSVSKEFESRAESELDRLIEQVQSRPLEHQETQHKEVDLVQRLRELVINDLLPVFVELRDKYVKVGITMSMDASPFLAGGREMGFEFKLRGHRVQMIGTVTTDVIAFCETRFAPDVHGELVSGPMLRIRQLTAARFRDFICERLSALVRTSAKWR